MTTLTNSFEGISNGTTITNANSGGTSGNAFDVVTIGAGSTVTSDNTHAAHGTQGAKLSSTSATEFLSWTTSMAAGATRYFRLYLYLTANPGASCRMFRLRSGSTFAAAVLVTSAGKISAVDSTSAQMKISTTTVPLNAWFRVEGFFTASATAGQCEFKIFTSMDSTTPVESQTSNATFNTLAANFDTADFGPVTAETSFTVWLDDVGLSNTGYIGPAVAGGGGGAGTPGLVGAYLNPGAMGVSTQAQANSLWSQFTGGRFDVRRVYYTTGQIPSGITADLQADVAAGRKAAISMRPAFNPPTTADLDALNTFLASCKAAGLVADVSLWQEPYGSGLAGHVSAGLTISLFINGWQFYAPTIRQYYPMVFDTSIYSVNHHNENAYYPGDAYVDKVATDFYCSEYDGGERLDLAASLADGATPAKPFGLWELNSSTDPTSGQTQAQSTAYFTYIQNYFAARLQAGKTNADLLLFNSNTLLTQETAITSASDYRVGLYDSLYDALSGGGGPPLNPANLASQLDSPFTNLAESLTIPAVIPPAAPGPGTATYPQLVIEAGFTPAAPVAVLGSFILDDPVFGRLDSSKLASNTIWTDISAFVKSGTITRPSSRVQGPLIAYQPGTVSLVLKNGDGRFDPDNTSSPYSGGIRAMIPVRVTAIWNGTAYPLFYGFADSWQDDGVNYGGQYAQVTLSATDGFKVLQGITLAAAVTPIGDNEDSGSRIRRILTAAGWFTDKRQVAAGNTRLQGTVYGDTALNLMQIAADTEIGELYMDGSGQAVFRNRQAILTDTRSNTPQAIFGDSPGTIH